MKKILLFLLPIFLLFIYSTPVHAQSEVRLEGVVTTIKEEKVIEIPNMNQKQLYQKLEVLITSETRKGEKLTIDSGDVPIANLPKYQVGDKIVISQSSDFEGHEALYITDYVRRGPLYLLFTIFVAITLFIARKTGLYSLIGMALSFFIIFSFVLPQILKGYDPIVIAILASLLIIPITFYLSHGFNRKTTAAVLGTLVSLIITGVLANIFVNAVRLTGFASEEAGFLEIARPDFINIKGLLLAGIIIGVLGILDDITISQSAIVFQLKKANPQMKLRELYTRTMDVGRDHIASMVNTLILVYTGAALPLLLLFVNTPHPFAQIINYEMIAEEIVRTLVGSIGLILAVPITTFITVLFVQKRK